MIIDLHVHLPGALWESEDMSLLVPAVAGITAGGRAAAQDQPAALLLGLRYGEARNRALAALVERFPDQLAAPWLLSGPREPGQGQRAIKEYGFKGIKLYEEQPYFPLWGLLAGHGLYDVAAKLGVPVLIHSWHTEEGLEKVLPDLHTGHMPMFILEELGKHHPETTFIFAHAAGCLVKAFQAAQPYPNICFDVCRFSAPREDGGRRCAGFGP